MEESTQKQEISNWKVVRRLLDKNFLFFEKKQLAASAKQAGVNGRRRRDEAAAKNCDYERSESKGRMNAESRWWVSELLAADCEKAWIHTGWEDTMQKWYEWLEHIKKEYEKEKWRRCISERWRR